MIYLILIGGGLFILLSVISAVFFIGKSSGKKEERYETMEKELESTMVAKKRRIKRNNDSIDDVDARLRQNTRDR